MENINKNIKIGYAMCGSFCTLKKSMNALKTLTDTGADVTCIMSEKVYSTDTRFGKAEDFIHQAEKISGKTVLHTINEVEPIGPKKLFDLLVICPCTGSTLSKIASGISDTSVTLSAKAHLRNQRPILLSVSSNDALSANAKNIGVLLNTKHVFFVPFGQDDAENKPTSLISSTDLLVSAVDSALSEKQLQPILI